MIHNLLKDYNNDQMGREKTKIIEQELSIAHLERSINNRKMRNHEKRK